MHWTSGDAAINVKEDVLIIDDVAQGVGFFNLSTTDHIKTFDVPFAVRRLEVTMEEMNQE